MTELCSVGSATHNPCTNVASAETHFGTAVCGVHKAMDELALEVDDFGLVEELLGEAIEKAQEIGAPAAMPILEHARDEARRERGRVEAAMDALDPKRG